MCQERRRMRPHKCVLLRENESKKMNIRRVGEGKKRERERGSGKDSQMRERRWIEMQRDR